jgi:hypothetical protein
MQPKLQVSAVASAARACACSVCGTAYLVVCLRTWRVHEAFAQVQEGGAQAEPGGAIQAAGEPGLPACLDRLLQRCSVPLWTYVLLAEQSQDECTPLQVRGQQITAHISKCPILTCLPHIVVHAVCPALLAA